MTKQKIHKIWKKIVWYFSEPNRVIATFTVVLALIGLGALWISKDTEQRDLRAYVSIFIDSDKIQVWDNPKRYAVPLLITNHGKTWGRNLRIIKKVVPQVQVTGGDPFNSLKGEIATQPISIAPDQVYKFQFAEIKFSDIPIMISQKRTGDNGDNYIALIQYEDVFSTPSSPIIRKTELSYRLNIASDNSISFAPNSTHNCVDDDCQKYAPH